MTQLPPAGKMLRHVCAGMSIGGVVADRKQHPFYTRGLENVTT